MSKQTRTEQCRAKFWRRSGRAKGRETRIERAEIEDLLEQTAHADSLVRRDAVRELCPCHIQANDPRIWDRLLLLAADPDADVRRHVLHTLADGSPRDREPEVLAALEAMYQDPDPKIRKQVRYLLAQYRRSGRINIL